jgi:hypothetical protein
MLMGVDVFVQAVPWKVLIERLCQSGYSSGIEMGVIAFNYYYAP